MRRAHAHTLLELVVVLMVLSTVAAIVLPRMSDSTQRYRSTLAARRIEADMRLLARRAWAAQADWCIEVDPDALTYSLYPASDPDSEDRVDVALNDDPYRLTGLELPTGTPSPAVVTIDAYGQMSGITQIWVSSGSTRQAVTLRTSGGGGSMR